ncbi:phytanoyl-CoA dioxygenase family protein [Actinopolymorpha singaporensis]|uniref:Phytanoyl-CoA dioxygenase (PhyH) n=1 Tax=Actinopolymorpha singaporensis TaxID=117157 RepID=A0A1H1V288_9ACTN|nr:phytanoyl-CoA dioxygenase family protein [Actinopolymorpha singaporensis]SDS78730.1 Phytanoyl-CoA dioxygenase (PhyH) [Actinopolymorpha singaporensis]
MLTDEDVRFFRANGYLLPHTQLFSEDKLARLEAIFNRHLRDKGDKLSDELDTPHFRDPELLDFLLSDEVLDTVEPLVGPDIALWTSHFISKDPKVGRATPWHEDSAYWKGRLSAYDRIVTVWLALEKPSDTSNGCMRVIPGTHVNGFSDNYAPTDRTTQTFHAEIQGVDESRAVDFVLDRGEFSLHDGRIIHGAKPNTSDVRRTGYTMRYFPASVRVLPVEQNAGWKIWLARGRDTAGNVYQPERTPSR